MFPGMSSLPPRASTTAVDEAVGIESDETPQHEEMESAAVDISPESVCYRDEMQKCGNCQYMEASGECQALKMPVEAEASCNLFKEMSA